MTRNVLYRKVSTKVLKVLKGFKQGLLKWRGKQPAGCGIWAGRRNGFRQPDFPVKN